MECGLLDNALLINANDIASAFCLSFFTMDTTNYGGTVDAEEQGA
jgi:hypothetical protein